MPYTTTEIGYIKMIHLSVRVPEALIVWIDEALEVEFSKAMRRALRVSMEQREVQNAFDYRVGLNINTRDGEKSYFDSLNEAVTEELVKKVITNMPEFYKSSLFKEELKQTKELIQKYPNAIMSNKQPLFDQETFFAEIRKGQKNEKGISFSVEKFTYLQEREMLNMLIDKILEKNLSKFKNRQEIFDLFAKAMLTGNILPIGRLIDKTFGQGTFRKIGEEKKNINLKIFFIKSL